MLLYQLHLQFPYDLTWQQFQYLQTVVIHTYFNIIYLHNFLMYVLYPNELFCCISLIDKSRSRLHKLRFKLTGTTLYTQYTYHTYLPVPTIHTYLYLPYIPTYTYHTYLPIPTIHLYDTILCYIVQFPWHKDTYDLMMA
jgi:hypothetical protein